MVAEMTGSLSILTRLLVGVGLAWLIVHHVDDTIYRSQILSRSDTEARRLMAGLPLLATIATSHAMAEVRLVLPSSKGVAEAVGLMEAAGVTGAPVVDAAGRFEGTVAQTELADTHVGSASAIWPMLAHPLLPRTADSTRPRGDHGSEMSG